MDRKALEDEILELENTINDGGQSWAQDDDIAEDEIFDEMIEEDVSDEELVGCDYAEDEDEDEGLGTMYSMDDEVVSEEPELVEEIAAMEEQLGCMSRRNRSSRRHNRGAAIDNPVNSRGLLWQDHDAVEELMGVSGLTDNGDSDGGDVLASDVAETDVGDSDIIYAKNLKEAQDRLNRVAGELESRGGKWVKLAYRLDQFGDAIQSRRGKIAKRIASRLSA